MPKYQYQFFVISQTGSKHANNQDNFLVKAFDADRHSFCLAAVADGMGGLSSGQLASNQVIDGVEAWWETVYPALCVKKEIDIDLSHLLEEAFQVFNSELCALSKHRKEQMGTTLSILLILDGKVLIKNIGDSRIYALNSEMQQLSMDHTWVNLQVEQGKLSREEALHHPRSHVLTQCIGAREKLLDVHSYTMELRDAAWFLICSDGFYKRLDREMFLRKIVQAAPLFLQSNANTEEVALKNSVYLDSLLKEAVCQVQQDGENDDITGILVRYAIGDSMGDSMQDTMQDSVLNLPFQMKRWLQKAGRFFGNTGN